MRLNVMASSFLVLASAVTAQAADLPSKKSPIAAPVVSPWDFTVSGALTTNYIFRGISQSNNSWSVNSTAELRYNFNPTWQAYVGVAGNSIKLTPVDVNPSMELDLFGGVRGTFGNLTTDVGVYGYIYPGLGRTPSPGIGLAGTGPIWVTNPSWVEVYGKLGYAFTDSFSVGLNVNYTPSYLDTKANGTYVSATAKYTIGDFAISGELGRQFLGTTDLAHSPYFGSRNLPDYTYYNVGASYTYKFATLDLRVHSSSLNKLQCQQITGPTTVPFTGSSKLCGTAVVGTLSFALQAKDLK